MARACDRCGDIIAGKHGFSCESDWRGEVAQDNDICKDCMSWFLSPDNKPPKKPYTVSVATTAVVEPVCKFSWYGFIVRCWLKEHSLPTDIVQMQLGDVRFQKPPEARSLAVALAKHFDMNACEVTDQGGNGVVFYPEWP